MKELIDIAYSLTPGKREKFQKNLLIIAESNLEKLTSLNFTKSTTYLKNTGDFNNRREQFRIEVEKVCTESNGRYSEQMGTEFFNWWGEPDHKLNKMKFEMQKTWSIKGRLNTWFRRSLK